MWTDVEVDASCPNVPKDTGESPNIPGWEGLPPSVEAFRGHPRGSTRRVPHRDWFSISRHLEPLAKAKISQPCITSIINEDVCRFQVAVNVMEDVEAEEGVDDLPSSLLQVDMRRLLLDQSMDIPFSLSILSYVWSGLVMSTQPEWKTHQEKVYFKQCWVIQGATQSTDRRVLLLNHPHHVIFVEDEAGVRARKTNFLPGKPQSSADDGMNCPKATCPERPMSLK